MGCCADKTKLGICQDCKVQFVAAKWGYEVGDTITTEFPLSQKVWLYNNNYVIISST